MSFIESWYAIFEFLEVDSVFFVEIEMDFANIGRRGKRSLHVRNRRIFLTILFWLNSVFMIMSTRSSYALVEILCLLIQQNRAAVVKSWKYGKKLLSKDDNLSSSNAISTNIFSSAKSLASSLKMLYNIPLHGNIHHHHIPHHHHISHHHHTRL